MRENYVDMIRSLTPMADPTLQSYSLLENVQSCVSLIRNMLESPAGYVILVHLLI